jgi:LacY proton/sugar symporter
MIWGALGAGALSIPYLFAVSRKNEALAIVLAVLTVGVCYQAWNATFASFFQELFPTRTRVTGFALSQNIGLTIVAFLPTVFTLVAPPGSSNVPLTIGLLCFGITIIGAVAAWSAPETYRVHLNDLGTPDAVPVPREEYERIRTAATV